MAVILFYCSFPRPMSLVLCIQTSYFYTIYNFPPCGQLHDRKRLVAHRGRQEASNAMHGPELLPGSAVFLVLRRSVPFGSLSHLARLALRLPSAGGLQHLSHLCRNVLDFGSVARRVGRVDLRTKIKHFFLMYSRS